MRTTAFLEGVQAIEWTVEERGLAGVSDLEGLPWAMPMEAFFEAWVETVLEVVARRTGGRLKTGRRRETVHPIRWEPPYLGSQKSLAPDLWLEFDDWTIVVDAKYKRHWEELQHQPWRDLGEDLRDEHRQDLMQALGYVSLARTPHAVTCLAYPCSGETWKSLAQRERLFHKAQIGGRPVGLWLTALPMSGSVEAVADPLSEQVRALLSGAGYR